MPTRRGGRVELSIHADDHVALFQAQPEERLEAVRPDPEVRAQVHQGPPQLDGSIHRVVQLERGLAGEREAHDVARHASDVRVDVAEEAGWVGEPGTTQQSRRERARDVDRAERHRAIHDVDAETPCLDPVADPHLGVGRATGREAQHEPRLRFAQDHAVVHDVAAFVEQERIPGATRLDVRDVAWVEALQRLDDVRAGHDELAERADITQRDPFADGPVLGDRIAVVPRTPPGTEPVHPGTRREVLVVERRPAERIDGRVGGRLPEGDLAGGGPGREGRRHLPGPGGDPRADAGQARAALAGAETGLAGTLEQLELVVALVPGRLEVRHGRAHARADDAVGGRRRERVLICRGPDDAERHLAGHPCQHVSWGSAETEDHGIAGRRRLGPRGLVSGDDGRDAIAVALETHEATRDGRRREMRRSRPHRDRGPERHARAMKPFRGARRQEAAQPAPRRDRVDLGGPGREHDLCGVHVQHPGRRADDDRRAGVDRHDLVPVAGVQDDDRLSDTLGDRRGVASRGSTADDRDVYSQTPDLDLARRRRRGDVRRTDDRQRRQAVGRMADHREAGACRGLTRSHVRDPVDCREAVPAITRETQRSAAPR